MKLPIDGYQLLNLGFGADAHNILTNLEKKMENVLYSGFSEDTLKKRKELLIQQSKLLLEDKKVGNQENVRHVDKMYANDGINIERGLEIPGLLVLLEAGLSQECLTLADDYYHQHKSKLSNLSTEYHEINLLIDLATLDLSQALHERRHYENSAELLERRYTALKKERRTSSLMKKIQSEIERNVPYRILDLLSRKQDDEKHRNGIRLLRQLVKKRGGLENESNLIMSNEEFRSFFRQIKNFLTAQEQIDLYCEWGNEGSELAEFLRGLALVALGYTQRKPERIKEALYIIEEMKINELQPVIANVHLLLGNINTALDSLEKYADKELKDWYEGISGDKLGQLCAWCQEWLRRDVLCGYRDIDTEPDLESYFSDRDVTSYIEQMDIKQAIEEDKGVGSLNIFDKKHNKGSNESRKIWRSNRKSNNEKMGMVRKGITQLEIMERIWKYIRQNKVLCAIGGMTIIVGTGLLLTSQKLKTESRIGSNGVTNAQNNVLRGREMLREQDRELSSLNETIGRWHKIKILTLRGEGESSEAEYYASPQLVANLRSERELDRQRGERQYLDVKIRGLRIIDRSKDTATVEATLEYSDKRVDSRGDTVSMTEKHTFKRLYRLIKRSGKWIVT